MNYSDKRVLLKDVDESMTTSSMLKSYRLRWYILIMFSIMAATQAAVWNTWGPIALSAKAVYGWNNFNIALFPNWGVITFLLGFAPVMLYARRLGLRFNALIGIGLVSVGCILRLLPGSHSLKTIFYHSCAILNGFAGCIYMILPTYLSSVWFPAGERTTSTAVASSANGFGIGIAFLLGPLFVSNPPNATETFNQTMPISNSSQSLHDIEDEIFVLLICEAVFSNLQLVIAVLFFPASPPSPPSMTASSERYTIAESLPRVLKLPHFWLIAVSFGLTVGIYAAFSNILDVNLGKYNIGQDQSSWIGFASIMAGIFAGVVLGRVTDLLRGKIRYFLIALFTMATLSFVWFVLICEGVIQASLLQVYFANICGGLTVASVTPLCYEMACEVCYPIGEEVPSTILTIFNTGLLGIVLLVIMLTPEQSVAWLNFTMVGCCAAAMLCMLLFRESYNRLTIDTESTSIDPQLQ